MSSLSDAIEILRESTQANIQLDIFRKEEIWLQVIKAHDLSSKWNYKPEPNEDLIIVLFFHPSKARNEKNFKRFAKSSFYANAISRDLGVSAYLFPVQEEVSNTHLETLINQNLH